MSTEHRAVWGKFLGERVLHPLSPWMARGALCVCTTDWPWAGVTVLGDGTLHWEAALLLAAAPALVAVGRRAHQVLIPVFVGIDVSYSVRPVSI